MAATSEENLKKAIAGIEKDIPDVKDRVIYFPTDVTKQDDVKAWIEGTVAKWGDLDGAANVAGKMPCAYMKSSTNTICSQDE
jgi:NADP-dependent 3-hydroxy acid dehydrogenase YdfG